MSNCDLVLSWLRLCRRSAGIVVEFIPLASDVLDLCLTVLPRWHTFIEDLEHAGSLFNSYGHGLACRSLNEYVIGLRLFLLAMNGTLGL